MREKQHFAIAGENGKSKGAREQGSKGAREWAVRFVLSKGQVTQKSFFILFFIFKHGYTSYTVFIVVNDAVVSLLLK